MVDIGGSQASGWAPIRIENINPSDTRDVIGLYAQANFDDLERSIEA